MTKKDEKKLTNEEEVKETENLEENLDDESEMVCSPEFTEGCKEI